MFSDLVPEICIGPSKVCTSSYSTRIPKYTMIGQRIVKEKFYLRWFVEIRRKVLSIIKVLYLVISLFISNINKQTSVFFKCFLVFLLQVAAIRGHCHTGDTARRSPLLLDQTTYVISLKMSSRWEI